MKTDSVHIATETWIFQMCGSDAGQPAQSLYICDRLGEKGPYAAKIIFQLTLAFANNYDDIATCFENLRLIGRIVCELELFLCTDCTKHTPQFFYARMDG